MRIKKLELGFPMFIQVRPADFWPTYYAQILIKLTFKGASWSKKNLWKESWPFCKGFLGKNAEKKLFLGAIGAQRGDSYWRTDSLTDTVICRAGFRIRIFFFADPDPDPGKNLHADPDPGGIRGRGLGVKGKIEFLKSFFHVSDDS